MEAGNMSCKEGTRSPLFWITIFVLCSWKKPASAATINPTANCPTSCGDTPIPFPFGIGEGCFRDADFAVYCSETFSPTAYLFSNRSNMQIISVSVILGELVIYQSAACKCQPRGFNVSYGSIQGCDPVKNFTGTSTYQVSQKRNKFTVVGCNAIALLKAVGSKTYSGGCASVCMKEDFAEDGLCSGSGCCQTAIPKNLNAYDTNFYSLPDLPDNIPEFNPCSYAFVAEENSYVFQKSDLESTKLLIRHSRGVPMVLEWVVGNETCDKASLNSSSYACASENSICNSTRSHGYFCSCSEGYEGNPYIKDGCHDVDECKRDPLICNDGRICKNIQGNYTCECPEGSEHDTETKSCVRKRLPALPMALGLSTGILIVIITASWLYWGLHRRKIMLSRKNFFEQNGGFLLKRHISQQPGLSFGIYTEVEMEKATNKFKEVLGQGGQGTVYRGVVGDGVVVAIKKSRSMAENQRSDFAKEMLFLSQINHRHVVRLLGCCLEVDIPMLVYEFVSGGTLYGRLHGPEKHSLTFVERLTIAIQSASALNYLHAEASPPIVHGDVKSANILLDDNSGAKLSDFGASKLAPMDKDKIATVLQGTYGYLDPESLHTYQLSEKSDVYSFGVVLAELITRRMALYEDDTQTQRTLASETVAWEKAGQLREFLDQQIVNEADLPGLQAVAGLACRCLSIRGEDRPTMKEVMMELEGIRSLVLSRGLAERTNEDEPLLGDHNAFYESNTTSETFISEVFGSGGR